MAKKMLLAAVSDYQGFAHDLVAATKELDDWQRLLTSAPYGFSLVRPPLKNAAATRDAILDGFEELLKGARANDQLLLIFCGHGSRDARQQVIVAYPNGNADLRKATITVKDLEERLKKQKPAADVDVTIVLESCFTDGTFAEDRVPLYVRLQADGDIAVPRDRGFRRFIDLSSSRLMSDREIAQPVIVTAAKEGQAAYQAKITGTEHLLFSYRAIDRLRKSRRTPDTFRQLINNIIPLRSNFQQEPDARGSDDRLNERFPGEPEPVRRAGGDLQRGTALDGTSPSIQMRLMGLGCFIQPRMGGHFANRVVFPYDFWGQGANKHFAFVEVAEEDISSITGNLEYARYWRAGRYYKRWQLNGHTAWLANADDSQPFMRSDLFETHVPSMPVLCPELTDPRDECYDDLPDPQLFTGFINLVSGSVGIGQLDGLTSFARRYGDIPTPWGPERTPYSVLATLPFVGERAILLIEDQAAVQTVQIFIKPDACILAGNAREVDITGDGSGAPGREQFLIYYSLASQALDNPALPKVESAPIDACSMTKWP